MIHAIHYCKQTGMPVLRFANYIGVPDKIFDSRKKRIYEVLWALDVCSVGVVGPQVSRYAIKI